MINDGFQVAVVGAGMVGASVAIYLEKIGVRVLLIENKESLTPLILKGNSGYEPRVSAISISSENWLKTTDTWNLIDNSRLSPYEKMSVWDGNGTGLCQFNSKDTGHNELGHIVENNLIQEAQLAQIDQSNIQVITGTEIEKVTATVNGQLIKLNDGLEFQVDLIIGADGANSRVRELAGIQSRKWDYHHQAIVTTVKTALSHEKTARQVFLDQGPLALLPLSNHEDKDHYCSIVWSTAPEHATQLLSMDDYAFGNALTHAMENQLGQITASDKRHSFQLQQCHAVQYVKTGFALIGDAAHRIHPLAGQGVNLGFLDAASLCEHLETAFNADIPLSELFHLRQYQRARQSHNLAMIGVMEGFKRLFDADPLPVRWLRNWGMKAFNEVPFVKEEVIKMAMGLNGAIPKLCK